MDGKAIIHIGGKPVELFFGYTAHRQLMEGAVNFNRQFIAEDGGLTEYGIGRLFLAAYENKCLNDNKRPEYVFDDLMQYLDTATSTEEGRAELGKALEAWSQSAHTKKMIEEAKKKGLLQEDPTSASTSTNSNEPATDASASAPGNSTE